MINRVSKQFRMPKKTDHKYLIIIYLIVILFTLLAVKYPVIINVQEINKIHNSTFDSYINQSENYVVLLPDDVMIAMRASKIFLEHGITSLNVSDISQPATSYILPIILSPIFKILPDNHALILISFLGFLLLLSASFIIIQPIIKRYILVIVFLVAFLLNSTMIEYSLSGWEHVWQPVFILLAWKLGFDIYEGKENKLRWIIIGFIVAFSILLRIDSAPLVIGLAFMLLYMNYKKAFIYTFTSFIIPLILYFYFQLNWFGTLVPTTARLKASSLQPTSYIIKYALNNIFYINTYSRYRLISFTAITWIIIILIAITTIYIIKLKDKNCNTINIFLFPVSSVVIGFTYATLVSDAFPLGRMYIPILALAMYSFAKIIKITFDTDLNYKLLYNVIIKTMSILLLFVIIPLISNFFEEETSPDSKYKKPEIELYFLTEYIKANFDPSDGAIGTHFLGTPSFYLHEYTIADFLGKGDEMIANSEVKWGPPGHNKWDSEQTIKKWNPAIIIYDKIYFSKSEDEIHENLNNKIKYAFWDDAYLALKESDYVFVLPFSSFDKGLYIRKDLISKIDSNDIFVN